VFASPRVASTEAKRSQFWRSRGQFSSGRKQKEPRKQLRRGWTNYPPYMRAVPQKQQSMNPAAIWLQSKRAGGGTDGIRTRCHQSQLFPWKSY
jgi:hypothetical protein